MKSSASSSPSHVRTALEAAERHARDALASIDATPAAGRAKRSVIANCAACDVDY